MLKVSDPLMILPFFMKEGGIKHAFITFKFNKYLIFKKRIKRRIEVKEAKQKNKNEKI